MGVVLTIWNYFFKARPGKGNGLDLMDDYKARWGEVP